MNSSLLNIALKVPFKIKPLKKFIISPIITSTVIYLSSVLLFFTIIKILINKSKS